MSHPEHILAIDKRYFYDLTKPFKSGITVYNHRDLCKEAQEHLAIRQRQWLDGDGQEHRGDPRYLQILPYFTVVHTDHLNIRRYLVYQRVKGSGESRLLKNYSIGFGGHVDLGDVVLQDNSVIDLESTLIGAVHREAHEELLLPTEDMSPVPTNKVLLDTSNEVGRLHVALLHELHFTGDIGQIHSKENGHVQTGWMTLEELVDVHDFGLNDAELESWSKILIKHLSPE